ncbi:MAG: energy transducer TonB, partial [Burkholderiales bacterium]|nr:energy transducer TonB [Burkholderiales bacterium]
SPAVPPAPAVAAFESPGPPDAVAAPGAARAPAPPPSTATLPETAASYLSAPAPRYPLAARRDGIEGRVTVRVLVSAQGTPARVEIAQSSGSEILDRAAVQAVSAWRFAPARRGSQPVDAWVLVPVEFHLRSG